MIYLDNSATTQLDAAVLEEMLPWLRQEYGNASSIYEMGRRARVAVERARTEIAGLIGAHPAEITFTSGGTESNNSVLKSVLSESGLADRLCVSAIEHHAVLHPADQLREQGIHVEVLPVSQHGVPLEHALHAFASSRTLFSIMHANNETGSVQPLAAVRNAIGTSLLHSDAVQTLGKIPINVGELGVDFMSFSAHKLHGPKGIGAMFIRKGIDFKAHQQGGGQERNRRAGTEPVALIVGFAAAVRMAVHNMETHATHMQACIDRARTRILAGIADVRVNTPSENALPNVLNVSFRDANRLDGEAILQAMDMAGVAVSNGSACTSGSLQPSHVLQAIGLSVDEAKAAVRISVSKYTTFEEIDTACTLLSGVVRDMRV